MYQTLRLWRRARTSQQQKHCGNRCEQVPCTISVMTPRLSSERAQGRASCNLAVKLLEFWLSTPPSPPCLNRTSPDAMTLC